MLKNNFPQVQVALDFVDSERALKVAHEAVAGGANWLEAGTPLIKSEGLEIVRQLRRNFPHATIIADLKTMDAGQIEVETAAQAGADIVVCLAAATNATITQCVNAGKKYGVKIYGDTIGLENAAARAKELEILGVDFIGVHCPIDEQMQGKMPTAILREVCDAVKIPVAVAGGITANNAAELVSAGASIIIVGGAISKAQDAKLATAEIISAIRDKKIIRSTLGKRNVNTDDEIRAQLLRVSTANLSDALNHSAGLRGVTCRTAGKKMRFAGRAVTVKTLAGDWHKVVQAIDVANQGDVIIVDSSGQPPAVWGECATLSAINKQLSATVIYGAVRDTDVALELGYPIFSACVCPDAGEPKGFGEINCALNISGQVIMAGDWIVGDDDGVMILPQKIAGEYANRAVSVMESEQRLKAEIMAGSTLGKIAQLTKWEKVR